MGVSTASVKRAKKNAEQAKQAEPKPKSNAPANSRPWVDVEPEVWDAFKGKAAAEGVHISKKMGAMVAAAIQETSTPSKPSRLRRGRNSRRPCARTSAA